MHVRRSNLFPLVPCLLGLLSLGLELPAQCVRQVYTPTVAGASAKYGRDVSASGDWVAVGAPLDNAPGVDSGRVFVHRVIDGVIQETHIVTPADSAPGDQFGHAVAVSGELLLVGAPYTDGSTSNPTPDSGSAYLFQYDGSSWIELAELTDPIAAQNERTGFTVAVWESLAVVGSPLQGNFSGLVFVFRESAGTWLLESSLNAPGTHFNHQFGSALAVRSETLLIGARGDNDFGSFSGAAFVYRRIGASWVMQQKLYATLPGTDFQFGWTVALGEGADVAVIGSPWDDTIDIRAGSADIFRRNSTTGQWSPEQQLTASDAGLMRHFGQDVDLSGDEILIGSERQDGAGSSSGSAYSYHYDGVAWSESRKLVSAEIQDTFGINVALGGLDLIVGAPDRGSGNTGGIHIFRRIDEPFVRGDCSPDGALMLDDAIVLLDHLFENDLPPPCRDACDFWNDDVLDIGDAISLLSYLYSIGPPPVGPSASCGCESPADELECASFPVCP
jgi:hypothetical protein